MSNIALAQQVLSDLLRRGVREFCVCAGSRNSPLLAVLGSASRVRIFSFVDERSAAFFAVGRMKLHGSPVAVVTTSGTAAAELLPAAIEAYYSRLPLVLVTADRPARFRGTGAPQCIEQEGLFGVYAATQLQRWTATQPLHLNLEFDEPLIDSAATPAWDEIDAAPSAASAQEARFDDVPFERPLVIVGGLRASERNGVAAFVEALGRPAIVEPLSGLREEPSLAHLVVMAGERGLRDLDFDGVVRIGDVPVFRYWRDLEERERAVPVVHFTDGFTGLTRGDRHRIGRLPESPRTRPSADDFLRRDRERYERLQRLMDAEPQSEVAMLRDLSARIGSGTRVYLGNSLPVREWDLAAVRQANGVTVEASRGANGIDGQISTFLGQCDPATANVCIIGDLTAIYDSNGGWIASQLDPATRFTIYVINNGGGQIFSRVPSLKAMDSSVRRRIVENTHQFDFAPWAAMWGFSYGDPDAPRAVVELRPHADASRRFWDAWDAMWSARD